MGKLNNTHKILLGGAIIALVIVFVFPLLRLDAVNAGFASVNGTSDDQVSTWAVDNGNSVAGLKDSKAQREFTLSIPGIGLQHRVIENVNPGNEAIYGPIIEQYIAHGQYTRLPDEATTDGNVYLFAHREGAKNGRNFGYFKNLDKIREGDKAVIKYDGKTYTYGAYTSFVISPKDTWVYTDESNVPTLTLQTCENGESMRLIVKFRLVSVK